MYSTNLRSTASRGNIREAAGLLGIDPSTLYENLKRYEIASGERPNRSSLVGWGH
jgi:transcriptional regulator of acetoin/glycerol metabolism